MALNDYYYYLCVTEPNLSGNIISLESYLKIGGNITDHGELDKLDTDKDFDQNAPSPRFIFNWCENMNR